MEPVELVLLAGLVVLAVLIIRQGQSDSNFAGFMDSIGGSDIPLVPVSDTDTTVQSGGGGVIKSIQDWANAMFHVEGGNAGNLNMRNNNPGNLKAAPDEFTGSVTQRDANGFVIFPTIEAGWAALYSQLQRWVNEFPTLTFPQFYAKYLGQADYMNPRVTSQGDPFAYAKTVAGALGVDPNATIGSVFGGHL